MEKKDLNFSVLPSGSLVLGFRNALSDFQAMQIPMYFVVVRSPGPIGPVVHPGSNQC